MAPRVHAKTEEERKARKRERARLRQQKCRRRKKEAALKKQQELFNSASIVDPASTSNPSRDGGAREQSGQAESTMPPLPGADAAVTSDNPPSTFASLKCRTLSVSSIPSDSSTACSTIPLSPAPRGLSSAHDSSASLSLSVNGQVPNASSSIENRQHCSSSPDTIARFPSSTENSPRQLNTNKEQRILSTVVSFGLPQPIYISTPERCNRKADASSTTTSSIEDQPQNDVKVKPFSLSSRDPKKQVPNNLLYPEELTTPKPQAEDDLESVANAMLSLGKSETPTPTSMSSKFLPQLSPRQRTSSIKKNLPLIPEDSFFAKLQQQQHGQQQNRNHQQPSEHHYCNQQVYQHCEPPSIYAPFNHRREGMVGMARRMRGGNVVPSPPSYHDVVPSASSATSSVAIHPQTRPNPILTYRF